MSRKNYTKRPTYPRKRGRPRLPQSEKKQRVTIRLYPHQIAYLKERGVSLTRFVESALAEQYPDIGSVPNG